MIISEFISLKDAVQQAERRGAAVLEVSTP